MKPPTRVALIFPCRPASARAPAAVALSRRIHTTSATPATVTPIHGAGPPPKAPVAEPDERTLRLQRRKRQAELLRQAHEVRMAQVKQRPAAGQRAPPPRRFWQDVHVREVDGAWEVHLDERKVRHPGTKQAVRVPGSKPLLAAGLAVEWDAMTSTAQASCQHLIPLTSLTCRAIDIAADDGSAEIRSGVRETLRRAIARELMRYLETDSLLCWAPPPGERDLEPGAESLRDVQKRAAADIVGFLTTRVWPGVEIGPVLDADSIMPKRQKLETRQIIEGWVMGLSPWELAGLERGVLATKGLLGAARLVVEWSEGHAGLGTGDGAVQRRRTFGIEEAAKVASLEVDWQTRRWGEVEDTHDVEKEDLRRQLGSAVLVVSGTGTK